MGTVTALLVLAALLNSISTSLPQTSNFKYIDIWCLWYLANIFIIIIYHIILDMDWIPTERGNINNQVLSITVTTALEEEEREKSMLGKLLSKLFPFRTKSQYKESKITKNSINKMAIILFFIVVLCFNVLYFVHTT